MLASGSIGSGKSLRAVIVLVPMSIAGATLRAITHPSPGRSSNESAPVRTTSVASPERDSMSLG
jgi:hypothetical protein